MEILETHELLGVIENIPPRNSYWLDLAFPRVHMSTTEFIDFDLLDGARRLAPFVSPAVQGQPMVQRGHSTRKFKPAYVKMKDAVDPARLLTKRVGEALTTGIRSQQLTPAQRHDAIVADILATQVDAYERRLEWMAAKSVQDGAITIEGENYPRVQLSFGRSAAHTKTLTGTAAWTDTTNSNPIQDIEDWALEMLTNSGRAVTRITFGVQAWKAFIAHPKTEKMLDTNLRGGSNSLELGPTQPAQGGQYRGTLKSMNVDLYVYNDQYEDNTGVLQNMMDPRDVVLTGDAEGIRCFGAIMDNKANWQPLSLFTKMWEQEDPSGVFIMSQGAPLMVPSRPNATMRVRVRA